MPSDRQLAANRANALMSTGPRTRSGKQHAAANALRHGLSTRLTFDTELSAKLALDVGELAGGSADSHVRAVAHRVIEAELDLQRIKSARSALLDALDVLLDAERDFDRHSAADVLGARLDDLHRLDRYATRAYSRRDKAVCALVRAQSSAIYARQQSENS